MRNPDCELDCYVHNRLSDFNSEELEAVALLIGLGCADLTLLVVVLGPLDHRVQLADLAYKAVESADGDGVE
ncbi:hypothetical protein AB0C61_28575 [Streptomyces sp. NPDC048680]|uniref:hypothetical protein n=1 Tax=Streptomyces sp. NPDC048680 TaxID=3155492 RepID=UPI00341D0C9D